MEEVAAEKVLAASTRKTIAPRDFYDLGFFIEKGFDFYDKEFLKLVGIKLKEDGFDISLEQCFYNLNRPESEIRDMKARIKEELFSVLTVEAAERFNLNSVVSFFNKISKKIKSRK